MTHPHLFRLGTVRAVSDPLIGEFSIPGMPVKFSSWPHLARISAELLGASNDKVLSEILGVGKDEIAKLYPTGVLRQDPLLRSIVTS